MRRDGLTRARILSLFEALDDALGKEGVRGELYLVGGAVMCLAFDARRATRDVDGFFVPKKNPVALADKLIQLLSDKDLAARIGRNGRKRAEEVYSRVRMARDTAELYQRAVEIHNSRPVAAGTGSR